MGVLILTGACAVSRSAPAPAAVTTGRAGTSPPATAPNRPPAPPPPAPLRDRVLFGAYVPEPDDGGGVAAGLAALEARLGTRLEVASAFSPWGYVFGGPDDLALSAGGTRRVLHSWEPVGVRFRDIADGAQDAYLDRIAASMRAYPYDIWVRPWPELNAWWSSWQPTPRGDKPDGGTPAELVAAWRHLVGRLRSRGVRNLRFVFNPDASDSPANTPVASLWPGADTVDAIGIDGYNWGDADDGDSGDGDDGEAQWRDFESIFAPMYDIVTALPSSAPVWITEVGSKEPAAADGAPADRAHRKGEWLEQMLSSTRFPRLEAVAWFNIAKERDWRLESSPAALAATSRQLAARHRPRARG
jgi:hypothetical protein